MQCAYHNDREFSGSCSTCGKPICATCLVELGGQSHCKACLEARMRQPERRVAGIVRLVLSVVPGLGHLYMGLFNRGIQIALTAVAGGFVLDTLFPHSPLAGFLIAGMIFLSIFDAREAHLRLEQGLDVPDTGFVNMKQWRLDWNAAYVGYVLIGIGALALYSTLVQDVLRLLFGYSRFYQDMVSTINGLVLGALALGAGIWMLRRSMRNTSE